MAMPGWGVSLQLTIVIRSKPDGRAPFLTLRPLRFSLFKSHIYIVRLLFNRFVRLLLLLLLWLDY